MKKFKYLRNEMEMYVGGDHIVVENGSSDEWVAPLEVVADGSLASLRAAVLRADGQRSVSRQRGLDSRGVENCAGRLLVCSASVDDFDEDYSPRMETSVSVLSDESTALDVEVGVHGLELEEEDYERGLAPLMSRLGCQFKEAIVHGAGNQGVLVLRVAYGPRGATIGDAIQVGQSIAMFIEGLADGDFTVDGALAMLAAGRADLILGQPESAWLEVKSQGYDFKAGDADKIELAQDVARFANGEADALLLIGFKTLKDNATGSETISKMTSALTPFNAQQYHQIIDGRIFPPILGLTVEGYKAPIKGGRQGHLLAIRVPPQPEESKPFLVHGAVVDGKVEGAFISIVQRRGEHSVPTRPETIHATLAAGRALLRRGTIPR